MKDVLNGRTQSCIFVLDGDRVAIRHGATTTIVNQDEIVMALSERNITRIVTGDGELRIRERFHSALERLAAVGIMQVHRRAAVNPRKVRQLVGCGDHRLVMLLTDGRSLAVGRDFQPRVRRQFGAALQRQPEESFD